MSAGTCCTQLSNSFRLGQNPHIEGGEIHFFVLRNPVFLPVSNEKYLSDIVEKYVSPTPSKTPLPSLHAPSSQSDSSSTMVRESGIRDDAGTAALAARGRAGILR